MRPPLTPEIQLHLAEESLPIWRKSEEELGEMNVPPPYWAFAWAGGQALARFLLDNRDQFAGRTLLDIGTGSGLVAIAGAMAGADVTANDIDTYALAACRMNAAANRVAVTTMPGDLLAPLTDWTGPAQVICLADVFYESTLARRAMAFAEAARSAGSRVLVGDPRRSYFPQSSFSKIADYPVPVTRELEDAEIKNAAVWQLAD